MKRLERYGKVIAMSAAALGMTAALTIESSMAYFTTYVSAGGSQTVSLGTQTSIHEGQVVDMTKRIQVANTSQTNDCFVRVKVFCGAEFDVSYPNLSEESGWYRGADDYLYYRPALPASADLENPSRTSVLEAKIEVPEGFDKDNFNVVVIKECTPVIYDGEGNPSADWNRTFDQGYTGRGEAGNE